MDKRIIILWESLVKNLSIAKPSTIKKFLQVVLSWLEENLYKIDKKEVKDYGLDNYLSINLDDYPIDLSDINVSEEIQQLNSIPFSSQNNLAMRIRDIIWRSIAFQIKQDCPKCGDSLRVLFDPNAPLPALVLSCDRCSWSQWPDGRKWGGIRVLVPAKKEQLIRGCYIKEKY